MATPLCSTEAVADVIGIADDASTTARLAAVAAAASAFVRGFTRQELTLVTDDEITLRAERTRMLYLPELPVVSIDSITINGTDPPTNPIDDFTFEPDTGMVWRTGGGDFGSRYSAVVVVYTHGFATDAIPEDLAAATASIAARAYLSGPSVAAETIGAHTWRIDAAGGLTRLEEAVLLQYKPGRAT